MSQKHSLNSVTLALIFALVIFVVAFVLFLFVGDYRFLASFFMAVLIAVLAGVVLFLGFGTPSAPVAGAVAAPTAPKAQPAADSAEPAEAAEAARRTADDEAAAKRATDEQAARDKAEADAKAAAEAEAARRAAEAPPTPAPDAESTPDYDGDGVREGTNEGTRPAGLDAPRDGRADDLKQIKGIGPKLEQLCNRLGFWHFDQVAAWSADEIAWVDANLEGFKGRVSRDDWVGQAKVLASGGETEFSKRVEDGDVY